MSNLERSVPVETTGTVVTRFNALRHGVLSRYTVLPWERRGGIPSPGRRARRRARPARTDRGASGRGTGWRLWRKRRLRLAEAAAHRRGLDDTFASYRETVKVALVHLRAPEGNASASPMPSAPPTATPRRTCGSWRRTRR